jgi:hypothetical protein
VYWCSTGLACDGNTQCSSCGGTGQLCCPGGVCQTTTCNASGHCN